MASSTLAHHAGSARRRGVSAPVTVDTAGAQMGGAARFVGELYRYLDRTGRDDVRVVGGSRSVGPAWLLRREVARRSRGRFVALNNVSFVAAGGERWTLLANALHFMTEAEISKLDPSLRRTAGRDAAVVRMAARRSDVLVTPSTAMAERVARVLPPLRQRILVRPHPVSADSIPDLPRDPAVLCPVLFAPYKQMGVRLAELLAAIDTLADPSVRLWITAERAEVPDAVALHPRAELVGRLGHRDLKHLWGRSQAAYFPTGIESFGYPLAEARASGRPVIARDTAQSREIAGPALFGFSPGDAASLQAAVAAALTADIPPDPAPFDPGAYFDWMLGSPP
jgi:glycosyltransferase involved in cell wall biosynthesis